MLHQAGRKTDTGQHVLSGQRRVFFQNLFDGIASSQKFKHGLGRDPGVSNHGLAVAYIGVYDYPFHGYTDNKKGEACEEEEKVRRNFWANETGNRKRLPVFLLEGSLSV